MKLVQSAILLLSWAVLALPALAEETYVEGTHYTRLANPVPVRQPSKIEVAEIFSYACGHCFNFEGMLQEWKKGLPNDTDFVRVHVKWDRATENLGRALYAAQALNVLDKVHPALFRAIHVDGKRLQTKDQIVDLVAKQGVDREAFSKTFDSFGVTSQVNQAQSKVTGARITGTPSLLIGGQYVIQPNGKIDHATMLKVADYLIERIRQESS